MGNWGVRTLPWGDYKMVILGLLGQPRRPHRRLRHEVTQGAPKGTSLAAEDNAVQRLTPLQPPDVRRDIVGAAFERVAGDAR
jgi:hypothetical protein